MEAGNRREEVGAGSRRASVEADSRQEAGVGAADQVGRGEGAGPSDLVHADPPEALVSRRRGSLGSERTWFARTAAVRARRGSRRSNYG